MNTALFLDRSLVQQIYLAGKYTDPKYKAFLQAVAGIVARYNLVYFEPSGGVSLMAGDLFAMAMFRNKLSVVPDDAVALLPDERPLLSGSLEAFGKDPMIRQALQQYSADRRAVTRSDSEVLGYVVRLLLLGRSLKADIYPWAARLNLVLAVFGAAGCPSERTRLSDSADLVTFTCRGFPYAAPASNAAEYVSFGVVVRQAAAIVTGASGAYNSSADDDARDNDTSSGDTGRDDAGGGGKWAGKTDTDPAGGQGVLSATDILTRAIKDVPAVRYASGIAGVAAAASIVIGLLGARWGVVLGTMLCAMILLLVFARLLASPSPAVRLAGDVLLWVVVMTFCAMPVLGVAYLITGQPQRVGQILGF